MGVGQVFGPAETVGMASIKGVVESWPVKRTNLVLADPDLDSEVINRLMTPADFTRLPDPNRADVILFGEGPSRIVLSVKQDYLERVQRYIRRKGLPSTVIGLVGGDQLKIWGPQANPIELTVETLTRVWQEVIPGCLS